MPSAAGRAFGRRASRRKAGAPMRIRAYHRDRHMKRMNIFERYLSLWVALCMVAGVIIGKLMPASIRGLERLEFGTGSYLNLPMAILIWLMICPMMPKIDFGSIVR